MLYLLYIDSIWLPVVKTEVVIPDYIWWCCQVEAQSSQYFTGICGIPPNLWPSQLRVPYLVTRWLPVGYPWLPVFKLR